MVKSILVFCVVILAAPTVAFVLGFVTGGRPFVISAWKQMITFVVFAVTVVVAQFTFKWAWLFGIPFVIGLVLTSWLLRRPGGILEKRRARR
jgi:O-antigen/teichoic acid export membrane protein